MLMGNVFYGPKGLAEWINSVGHLWTYILKYQ